MPEALARVKRELGDGAVILGTRAVADRGLKGIVGGTSIEITAAPPALDSPAPRTGRAARGSAALERAAQPSAPETESALEAYYRKLVASEVADELARRILASSQPSRGVEGDARVADVFRRTVASMLPTAGPIRAERGRRRCAAFFGPAGAGKTTTVAKLAAHFRLRDRLDVAIVSLDVHGVARHDAVRRFGELIGATVHTPGSLDAARETSEALNAHDVILIDTCGIGTADGDRLEPLESMLRLFRPDERHLVLPASMNVGAQAKLARLLAPLRADRLALTRLDEVVGMGVILNTVSRLDLALSYLTHGQRVPTDIEHACERRVAEAILS